MLYLILSILFTFPFASLDPTRLYSMQFVRACFPSDLFSAPLPAMLLPRHKKSSIEHRRPNTALLSPLPHISCFILFFYASSPYTCTILIEINRYSTPSAPASRAARARMFSATEGCPSTILSVCFVAGRANSNTAQHQPLICRTFEKTSSDFEAV